MASGWSNDGAVQDQIDATVDDAIAHARSLLHQGDSADYCEECGDAIPQARRQALPGVCFCVQCQEKRDKKHALNSGYNRRGSKDSQLR